MISHSTHGLLAMAALRACARRVARVHLHYGDSRVRCLVREEAIELVERPTRQPVSSVSTMSPDPAAYPLEILEGDAPSGAFGGLDDRFRDAVVLVAAEPGFLARQPPELLLGSLRPLPLKPPSLEVVLAADLLDRLATMPLSVAGGRDLHDAQVDSQELAWFDRLPGFPADLDVHEEPAVPLHQLGGGGLGPLEHTLLMFARPGLAVASAGGLYSAGD